MIGLSLFLALSLKGQWDLPAISDFCDSLLETGVNEPMIPGAILSIVTRDSIWVNKGYGYSDVENKIPVNPAFSKFDLGSIGKIMTSIAVLQQVENGTLNLNTDVNQYLKNWKLKSPFHEPVTLFHLLTHSAGFEDRVTGYMAKNQDAVQPLANYLPKNQPPLFQPPGLTINYSNYSYALAGHLVELQSNKSFSEYIQDSIFNPLGMENSSYFLPDNYSDQKEFAKGYEWRDQFKEVHLFPKNPLPAGSLLSTGKDMAIFMQALLSGQILNKDKDLQTMLFHQQFTNHPKLNGYTLGLEVQNFNGHRLIAKAGNITGFLSLLFLFPEEKTGFFISVNTETDNFLELFMEKFKKRFFPLTSQKNEIAAQVNINEYTGVYSNERTSYSSIEKMFHLFRGAFELYESRNGNILCFHNGEFQEYAAFEKDIFENLENPGQFLVFDRNEKGKINHLFRNIVIGGIEIPNTYKKVSWINQPRFLNDDYPFVILIICSYLLLPVFWLFSFVFGKKKKESISGWFHWLAFSFLALLMIDIIAFFIPLIKNPEQLFFGNPSFLPLMVIIHWIMLFNAILLLILSISLWQKGKGSLVFRLYYSIYSLAALSFIWVLNHYNFLAL